TLEKAFDLGETLVKIRKKCQRGEFLPLLEHIGIQPRMAQLYLRIHQMRNVAHLDDCASIQQALEKIASMTESSKSKAAKGDAFTPSLPKITELGAQLAVYADKVARFYGLDPGNSIIDQGYKRQRELLNEWHRTVEMWVRSLEHQKRVAAR